MSYKLAILTTNEANRKKVDSLSGSISKTFSNNGDGDAYAFSS